MCPLLPYPLQQHACRLISRILRHKLPLKRLLQYALAHPLRLREALLHLLCNLIRYREAALDLRHDAALLGEGREGNIWMFRQLKNQNFHPNFFHKSPQKNQFQLTNPKILQSVEQFFHVPIFPFQGSHKDHAL